MIFKALVRTAVFLAMLNAAWSQTAAIPDLLSLSSAAAVGDQVPKQPTLVPLNPAPDKLLDLPRLKHTQTSLIGGSLESIDRLRSRLVLRPFGRGKLTIAFDPRTQFVRGSAIASVQDLRPGDRVYVETVLDGSAVFAKTVHLPKSPAEGTAQGQVIAYANANATAQGSLTIRDQLSSQPVKFLVNSKTIINGAGVGPGALVQVSFLPSADKDRDKDVAVVSQITVLATPGSVFTFSGRITLLDLAAHQLVVANASDDIRYEIQFNPAAIEASTRARLQEGASVAVAARFTGQGYVAESVVVLTQPAE
jgi:Domain of unknown function (DUF5666)